MSEAQIPISGEITLSAGGRDFVLRPTFNALLRIEAATGETMLDLLNRIADERTAGVPAAVVVRILHEGIGAGGDKDLPSLEALGAMLFVEDGFTAAAGVALQFLSEILRFYTPAESAPAPGV